MRTFIPTILALALAATPAMAQSTDRNAAPKEGNKQSATASTSSTDNKTGTAQQGQQTSAPAKDDSMTTYDVNGSNAADAMGAR